MCNVLKAHGIEPARTRGRSIRWSTFLKAHWESLFATDFTTVEVVTPKGLVTFYILAVMHLKTRCVRIAGITPNPECAWMTQICRNLTDAEDGFLNGASHLIVDRDPRFVAMRSFVEQNTEAETCCFLPGART